MSETVFLDTNVLFRHLMQDIPEQADRATALIDSVALGTTAIRLPDTVVFETTYILQRVYSIPKTRIADELTALLGHPGVFLDHKQAVPNALACWRDIGGLSFADCYHLALAADLGFTSIYSFDKKMDRFPGVNRVEP